MGRMFSMTVLGLALAAGVLLTPRAADAQRTPDVVQDVEASQRTAHAMRTFGTTDVTTYRIHAYAFTGRTGVETALGAMTGNASRYCTSAGTCTFGAAVSLPSGARLEGFALEGCNTSANGILTAILARVSNNSALFTGICDGPWIHAARFGEGGGRRSLSEL
jgi:hypothetical protein